jgi:hypothetical protein
LCCCFNPHFSTAEALLRQQRVEAAKAATANEPDSVEVLILRGRIAMAENDDDFVQARPVL